MDSLSPTSSARTPVSPTNDVNRGGRPRDWKPQHVRGLLRLYLGTDLAWDSLEFILEEQFGWKPGCDKPQVPSISAIQNMLTIKITSRTSSAKKHLARILGAFPRNLRPKNDRERRACIEGLNRSCRAPTSGAARLRRKQALRRRQEAQALTPDLQHGGIELTLPDFSTSWMDWESLTATNGSTNEPYLQGQQFPDEGQAGDFTFPVPFHDASDAIATERQDTGFTTSTKYSVTSSLWEKVRKTSKPPTRELLEDGLRLLKRWTLSRKDPVAPAPLTYHQLRFAAPEGGRPGNFVVDRFYAGNATPGDFFYLDAYPDAESCESSEAHKTNVCWCRVREELRQVELMKPTDPLLDASGCLNTDVFGNTPFHALATAPNSISLFIHYVVDALKQGLDLYKRNSAGQTFLHLLHPSWFEEGQPLADLLSELQTSATGFDILAIDVYGRNCFHRMNHMGMDWRYLLQIASPFDKYKLNRRDAFGSKPLDQRQRPVEPGDASSQKESGLSRLRRRVRPLARLAIATTGTPTDSRYRIMTDLMQLISDNDTTREDAQGRNHLHGVAQVILGNEPMEDYAHKRPSQKGKGKRGKESGAESTEDTTWLGKRLSTLEAVLLMDVNRNHYDWGGQTPLMAFVRHTPDQERKDQEILKKMLDLLLESPAGNGNTANLEARNRAGETALHLAAILGRRHTMDILLEKGANPNTRNAAGQTALSLLDQLWKDTEGDEMRHARAESCSFGLHKTGRALHEPSLVDEWKICH